MDSKRIFKFLKAVAGNNNREWFALHRDEYMSCKSDFEEAVAEIIAGISEFDSNVAHLAPKDCIYRFYRDTRFSSDKSPYKRHFGAYICEGGKKSLRGGYYLHLQPDGCFMSCGCYYLPTNILTACRNEIMANIDEWRSCVEGDDFLRLFGSPCRGTLDGETMSDRGFGISCLKTCPKGFPRHYEFMDYLRLKDYAVWHRLDDSFFAADGWIDSLMDMFKVGLPLNRFVNAVVSDYD